MLIRPCTELAAIALVIGCATALMPERVHAQRIALDSVRVNDTTRVYAVTLTDGSRLIGQVSSLTADSVQVRGTSSATTLARSAVREVRAYRSSNLHNGALWFDNPHATRLLFSPTAIPLQKGEGYFADFWVFFASAAVGVTDRFTVGGGMSLFPTEDLTDNLVYAIPKFTVINRPEAKFAVGALAASMPTGSHRRESLGILYGVGTLGSRDNNVTLGTGFGYHNGTLSNTPILTLGAQARLGRRVSFITENWLVSPGDENVGFITYGVRILGETIAIDLAFGNLTNDHPVFPGIPLVGFATKF